MQCAGNYEGQGGGGGGGGGVGRYIISVLLKGPSRGLKKLFQTFNMR